MLDARARFLGAGHFAPIADALLAAQPAGGSRALLDAGTGTGYYLSHVLTGSPGAEALALDASAAAVSMSVAATGSSGLVADIWGSLPVRDQRCDVILCVFSPRNPTEFFRVVRPGGRLLVVTPTPEHLKELRDVGLVIGIHERKRERLDDALGEGFDLVDRIPIEFTMEFDSSTAADLTTMGPSGHHEIAGEWPGGPVTASVELSVFVARRA